MIDSRVLDRDPLTGVTEIMHYDGATDEITLELRQESSLYDLNAAEYAAHSDYGPSRWKGDIHKVGSIPLVELWRLQREGAIDRDGVVQNDTALLRVLNDRDYLKLRTMPGHL